MSRRGTVPAAVFLGAVTCCTLLPRPELSPPTRIGQEWLISADLHVHAFPGDGGLSPAQLRKGAARHNLHVIALTNHDQMLYRHITPRPVADGPEVLAGVEVTTAAAHVIALGVRQPPSRRNGLTAAIDEIHAAGGVAILAHPSARPLTRLDSEVVAGVDGIEVTRALAERADQFRRLVTPGVAPPALIGSSDFHLAAPLGVRRTLLLVSEVSERGVLDAIRAGRTAVRYQGRWLGDSMVARAADAYQASLFDHGHVTPFIAALAAWVALLVWLIRT